MTTRADGYPVVIMPSPEYFWRLHARLRARLPMWVVYNTTTREYPGQWVARMHVVLPERRPTRFVMTHDSLTAIRTLLPPGLINIGRLPADVPEIVEVWL